MIAQYVSTRARRGLHILFLLVALFALAVGSSGMWRVWREVGRPFGGFAWGWDPSTYSLSVVVETPWHWPGPQRGLRGGDRILAVDGRDPMTFATVYQAREVGEEITYLIARGDRQFTVRVPLGLFTAEQLFELYGFMFLTGLSCLLSGYFLVRDARDWPIILMAFTLLTVAGALLFHGHNGGISHFYLNIPALLSLFIPSYPLAGALLTHFFLIFPRPLPVLRRRPWLTRLPYAGAVAIILFHAPASLVGGLWNTLAFWLFLFSIAFGTLLSTARSLWSFFRPGPEGRGRVGGLGIAFAVGLLLVLGVGVMPFFGGRTSILLSGLLIPVTVIYPLALVYAVKNVELIRRLDHETAPEEQPEAEAQELPAVGPAVEGRPHGCSDPLTPRELEVLELAARGATNKDIARALVISEHTAATHLSNIYGKLGVSNKTAAVVEARRRGIL